MHVSVNMTRRFVQHLPDTLGHAQNFEYLTGLSRELQLRDGASVLERALVEYGKHVDLLKFMNSPTNNCWDLPSIRITTRPTESWRRIESGGVRVLDRCGYRGGDAKQQSAIEIDAASNDNGYPRGPRLIWSCTDNDFWGRVIIVSLFPLLSNSSGLFGQHVVYSHTFCDPGIFGANPIVGLGGGGHSYIGVTRQGWSARWRQHLSDARNGSGYHFHRAIRRWGKWNQVHQVLCCGIDFDQAMSEEEQFVEKYSLHPRGLNMIPGGHAGIRYLSKLGFETTRKQWENRHSVLRQFAAHCSRAGHPNPLAATRWRDDAYASAVITNNPRNFTLNQVHEARQLQDFDWSPEKIADRLGAPLGRVRRLLGGETYSRVH